MARLADLQAVLGEASLGTIWLPVLTWTVVVLPACAGLHLSRRVHPLVPYYGYLALLMALPLGFALLPFAPFSGLDAAPAAFLPGFPSVATASPPIHPSGTPGAAPAAIPRGFFHLSGALCLVATAAAAFRLLVLGRHLHALRRFRNALPELEDPRVPALVGSWSARLGVRRTVALRAGPPGSVPMTFGWLRPTIVLPADLLDDEASCRMALLHELIHVRRGDFGLNLLERLVSSVFAVHPGVWFLRRRIAHFREVTCDAEVLSALRLAPHTYARLLYGFQRTGSPTPAMPAVSFSASNLKKRLSAMQQFRPTPMNARRRATALLIGALFLLGPALLAACSGSDSTSRQHDAAAVSAYGSTSPAERDDAIRRLTVQMDYLMEELDVLRDSLQASDLLGVRNEQLMQRYQLLNSMYMQRLEAFETLKMEQETEARLAQNASPAQTEH